MTGADSPLRYSKKRILLSLFFFLAALQGIACLYLLSRIPSESSRELLWGLSLERIIWMGAILSLVIILLILALWTWRDRSRITGRLDSLLADRRKFTLFALLGLAGLLGGAIFALSAPGISEPFTQAYYIRLGPVALWIAGLGLEALMALMLYRAIQPAAPAFAQRRTVVLSLLIFGLFLLAWGIIARTKAGLVPESVGWNRQGAPLLETQVWLAWGIGLLYLAIGSFVLRKNPERPFRLRLTALQLDLLFSLVIWLVAALYWSAIPLKPSWFASPPSPPNNEWYPNSDASVYDITAQNVLIGEGFRSWESQFAVRPFYAFFLGLLHALRGPGYEPIINLQVLALALFPVFLYWVARRLHNRLSAVIVAGLIILREGNAIALADVITVSHAKLLMSDLPAALAVSLYLLLVVSWLQRPEQRGYFPLLMGGVLGFGMLIRPELGALLAVPAILSAPAFFRRPSTWFKNLGWLLVGLVLALSPWVWRNYRVAGSIFLETPSFRADLIAQRYSAAPVETNIEQKPGETSEQYNERMRNSASQFIQQHPQAIPNFIINHYMNSQIQLVLDLPSTFRLFDSAIGLLGHRSLTVFWEQCCSSESYVRRLPYWWGWDGHLPGEAVVPILLNLFLLAVGISVAWQQSNLAGLAPLLAAVIHLLVNAVFRNSGGRYILPVDWAAFLYFGFGLAQITQWGVERLSHSPVPAALLSPAESPDEPAAPGRRYQRALIGSAIAILLLAAALPVAEKVFPLRYTDTGKQELLDSLLNPGGSTLDPQTADQLRALLSNQGAVLEGRALYPRFHRSGTGEPGSTWASFSPKDYPRLSFYLIGPVNRGVVLPFRKTPKEFPNGADVLVFGCPGAEYFDALAVLLLDPADRSIEAVFLRYPDSQPVCPLASPD